MHLPLITAATLFLALGATPAQLSSDEKLVSHLATLAGEWEGTLEYLDYGDNETRVRLAMSVVYRETPGGTAYDIEFREPDGRIVSDAGRLERLPSGEVVLGADAHEVASFEAADDGFTLVLRMRGQDGGQPAEIRQVIEHAGDGLVVRKEVRFDGAAEFFTRNEVRLERRDGSREQRIEPVAS